MQKNPLKPGPHQQQCRSNIVECYNVECCLPFLATMSKQRSTLLPKTATMSNEFCVEISFFRQSRMLLRQSRTLLRHCCPKRQHCRSNRQHCRNNIQLCCHKRQQCRTFIVKFRHFDNVECCFDIVAAFGNIIAKVETN